LSAFRPQSPPSPRWL